MRVGLVNWITIVTRRQAAHVHIIRSVEIVVQRDVTEVSSIDKKTCDDRAFTDINKYPHIKPIYCANYMPQQSVTVDPVCQVTHVSEHNTIICPGAMTKFWC